ncbi:MAG: hypothetical protein Q9207_007902 [Kuettlingeria erythrocarpa]
MAEVQIPAVIYAPLNHLSRSTLWQEEKPYEIWMDKLPPGADRSNVTFEVIDNVLITDTRSLGGTGFGTGTYWFKKGGEGPLDTKLVETLKNAISLGFNHLDCADCYGTEEEVLDNIGDVSKAVDASLAKLQMDYVDLYLNHTPYYTEDKSELQRAWRAMERVKKSGKAKSIGVSNFQRPHLETILNGAEIIPTVNQIEFHPYLQRSNNYIPWMQEQGIEVSAFKGLAPVTVAKGGPLDETLAVIAQKHDTHENSVLLKWHMSKNVVPVTTTSKDERMRQCLRAMQLNISAEEQEEITQIGLKHHFRWWGNQYFNVGGRS